MNCLLAKARNSLPTQVVGKITWSAAGKSPAPPIGVVACHLRRPSASAETSRMCTYPTTFAGRTSCQVSLSRLVCIAMPAGTSLGLPRFRFDAYNLFNHPVLGFNSAQGNLSVDNGAGGRITAIETDASPNAPNGLRQLQFGVRFDF